MATITKHPVVPVPPAYTLELTEAELVVLKLHLGSTTISEDRQILRNSTVPEIYAKPAEEDVISLWRAVLDMTEGIYSNTWLEVK